MPSHLLKVAGAAVAVPADAVLDSWRLDLDHGDSLSFAARGVGPAPRWGGGDVVELLDAGTSALLFHGQITDVSPKFDARLGWVHGYRAEGWGYLANTIPFTSGTDGTGHQVWNLPVSDPAYQPDFSGQSVGQILAYVVANTLSYSSAPAGLKSLADLGMSGLYTPVAGDPAYLVDPASLAIVPPSPVSIGGPRWLDAVKDFLGDWYNTISLRVEPSGQIRLYDTTRFGPATLTVGLDPVDPPAWSRSYGDCATRVVIRGYGVSAVPVSLSNGLLAPGWTAAQQSAWKLDDFTAPADGQDEGTCNVTSATTVVVTSSNISRTWAASEWGPAVRRGFLYVRNSAATGFEIFEGPFEITDCTALVAGGTSTITISSSQPMARSNYDHYEIIGLENEDSNVWRVYDLTDAAIGAHLVNRFPFPVVWRLADGSYIDANVTAPIGSVLVSAAGDGTAPYRELVWPLLSVSAGSPGKITFTRPVLEAFSADHTKLETGGASVDGIPDDVRVLVAVATGAMVAAYPADVGGVPQYAGTAFTAAGIARTHWIDFGDWTDPRSTANMALLAEQVHKTVANVVYEGTAFYRGYFAAARGFGVALNVAGLGYATGLEAASAPVRSAEFRWHADGGGSTWTTSLEVSNRRKAFTGETAIVHPQFTREPFDSHGAFFAPQTGTDHFDGL